MVVYTKVVSVSCSKSITCYSNSNSHGSKNKGPRKFVGASRRIKETTKRVMLGYDTNKKWMSPESIKVWNEIEELIDIIDTLQKQEELNDLDFEI